MTTKVELTKDKVAALKWVAKAASKDVARPSLQPININGRIEACDGYRIHAVNLNAQDIYVEEGSYIPAKLDTTTYLEETDSVHSFTDTDSVIPKLGDTSFCINAKYLAEALSGMDGMVKITVNDNSHPIAIQGTSKDGIDVSAIIMPMYDDGKNWYYFNRK
jgi:DNA polymerase III sliding clamp (beta) subunit (PCNA family)